MPEPPSPERLTRDRIVRAAVAIVDESGPDALTMRGLAAAIGAPPMSLYRHVSSRDDVLEAVVTELLRSVPGVDTTADWERGFRSWSAGYRAMALAHPRALPLIASRPLAGYRARAEDVERQLALLRAAGASPRQAESLLRGALAMVSGFCLLDAGRHLTDVTAAEELRGGFPLLAEMVARQDDPSGEALFELVVDVIVDGVRRRLDA